MKLDKTQLKILKVLEEIYICSIRAHIEAYKNSVSGSRSKNEQVYLKAEKYSNDRNKFLMNLPEQYIDFLMNAELEIMSKYRDYASRIADTVDKALEKRFNGLPN